MTHEQSATGSGADDSKPLQIEFLNLAGASGDHAVAAFKKTPADHRVACRA